MTEFNIFGEYILLTIVLIIIGLFLEEWQPPLHKNIIAITVLILGLVLGYFMANNAIYGFCIGGLVYYKGKLMDEFKELKNMTKGEATEQPLRGEEINE